MRYTFAPLEGVTGYVYRNLHRRWFGGVERYYMPFISVGQSRSFSPREWQDFCPEHNESGDLVPQLLGKDAEGFIWAARELRALGYREINFNLGCPSGTVTAKGKGAGFLTRPAELEAFLDRIFSALEGPISIKTRLGYAAPEEFSALLELYNRYPIAELIIHPRVRQDFYRCAVRMEAFEAALRHSRNPVGYNGDLMSLSDCAALGIVQNIARRYRKFTARCPCGSTPSRVGRAETERRPAAISRGASFISKEAALRAGDVVILDLERLQTLPRYDS